jgi:hypothetical protein
MTGGSSNAPASGFTLALAVFPSEIAIQTTEAAIYFNIRGNNI